MAESSDSHPTILDYIKRSYVLRLLFFLSILFGCLVFASFVSTASIYWIFDISLAELQSILQSDDPVQKNALFLYQFFSALGMFLLPPVIYSHILYGRPLQFLKLDRKVTITGVLLIPILVISGLTIEHWLLSLNQSVELPSFLEGLRSQDEQIDRIMQQFLHISSMGDLLLTIFIVGVVAALSEEIFFRGFLQSFLARWTDNIHIGVWTAAFIFGAIHLQFYNVLPRFMLGVLFGYLFYWSRSLWIPVLAHFFHNSLQVVYVYIYPSTLQKAQEETMTWGSEYTSILLLSGVGFAGVLYLFYYLHVKRLRNA